MYICMCIYVSMYLCIYVYVYICSIYINMCVYDISADPGRRKGERVRE